MTLWLLVAVLLARFWWLLLTVGMLAGVWHVLREMASAASAQRELARREAEVVAARADEQQGKTRYSWRENWREELATSRKTARRVTRPTGDADTRPARW